MFGDIQDERQRLMRRNIVRYAVLAYVITLQRVSLRVKKRFPSWQHVVDSGALPNTSIQHQERKRKFNKQSPLVYNNVMADKAAEVSLPDAHAAGGGDSIRNLCEFFMCAAGLMLESERKIFELMDGKTPMSKYWMPLVWATNIINRARKEGMITSDHIVQTLLTELSDIRRRLGALIGYDTVCVPLVYTQVN